MSEKEAKRNHLGRGLSALIDLKEYEIPASSVAVQEGGATAPPRPPRALPIASLHPGRTQPRQHMDEAGIEELAESIRSKGVLQPILVRPHPDLPQQYEIIAGERRWRAAQKAQLHQIPVVISELSDQDALEISLIENLQRENLTPLEEARAYARLVDEFAYTQDQLASAMGKSRSHVANTLRLLGLPAEVKTLVDSGQLTAGHARALLMAEDPLKLARQVIKNGLNVRQTEKLVSRKGDAEPTAARTADSRPAAKDPNVVALETDLGNRLGLRVRIHHREEKGEIVLAYDSIEQLDGLLEVLTEGSAVSLRP